MNTTYKLQLETLSPVHIGAGQEKYWQKGLDYYYDSKKEKLYILNQKKILLSLSPQERSHFNAKVSTGKVGDFLNLFFSNNVPFDFSDFVYSSSIVPQEDIRTHIRNGMGQPYIPGSSLKGAIRSAIFNHILKNERISLKTYDNREGRERFKRPNDLERDVFGDITNNLMHFIQVSDVNVAQENIYIQHAKIFNLFKEDEQWIGGWKHALHGNTDAEFKSRGFSFPYECIMPEVELDIPFSISFDSDFLKYKSKTNTNPRFASLFQSKKPEEKLFQLINKHSKEYVKREIEFFRNYPDNSGGSEAIASFLDYILEEIDEMQSGCILRFGHGSGFHSITGDWRFDNHLSTINKPGKAGKRYKSRKTLFDVDDEGVLFDLLGFVKLKLQ